MEALRVWEFCSKLYQPHMRGTLCDLDCPVLGQLACFALENKVEEFWKQLGLPCGLLMRKLGLVEWSLHNHGRSYYSSTAPASTAVFSSTGEGSEKQTRQPIPQTWCNGTTHSPHPAKGKQWLLSSGPRCRLQKYSCLPSLFPACFLFSLSHWTVLIKWRGRVNE